MNFEKGRFIDGIDKKIGYAVAYGIFTLLMYYSLKFSSAQKFFCLIIIPFSISIISVYSRRC